MPSEHPPHVPLSLLCCGALVLALTGCAGPDLDRTDYLDGKVAVLYYSSGFWNAMTKGYVVFVDEDGTTESVTTEGMQYEAMAYNGTDLLFHEVATSTIVGPGATRFDRASEEYGAVMGGTLPDGTLYTVFNTGDTGDGYTSSVNWYDGDTLRTGSVDSEIWQTGAGPDGTLYLTGVPDSWEEEELTVTLYAAQLGTELTYEPVAEWTIHEEDLPQGGLTVNGGHLYQPEYSRRAEGVDDREVGLRLTDVDLSDGSVEHHPVATYYDDYYTHDDSDAPPADKADLPSAEAAWYYGSRRTHLIDDTLYLVDGTGQAYRFDTTTGEASAHFTTDPEASASDEVHTSWSGEELYVFFRNFEDEDRATLQTYDAATGEMTSELAVTGLASLPMDLRGLGLYDFLPLTGTG
ncbi:hypothetical protein GCM10007079_14490 [Nocardiopsis terrae]|uniref:DUF4374 domain-containing protein n=1 Tax=Nocardiopsis terrae TaxID=372655 RepID=A0ABR9HBE6_9ACTN|nr:hypothetical protein [Nocardiopsis terrae]MBE1456348.1 hypothetical protein [Nocardiopsis terrae]GHC77365.1 hypothetical protein GCM10007079_14490 [Nocardiopsis terrae]